MHPVKEGVYLIEMAFDRPVEPKLLEAVLQRAGFSDIVFDQAKGGAVFGALKLPSTLKAPAPAAKPAAPGALRSVAPAAKPGAVRPIARAPLTAPTLSRATMQRVAPAPSVRPGLGRPGAASPGAPAKIRLDPRLASALKSSLRTAPAQAPSKRPRLSMTPSPGGGGGEAAPAAEAAFADEGGGGGGGGFTPSSEPAGEELPGDGEAAETEAFTGPAEDRPDVAPAEVTVPERWRRWKEWGSPYSEGPRTQVSGAGGSEARVRFLARLVRPVMIQNKPGMSWLSIVPLAIDPYAPCTFKLTTKALGQGETYDVRFFSRDKKAASREAVLEALGKMGFDVHKLFAMRKNVTVPGRAGGGLTLWVGRGTWTRPSSLIVAEDPFFFEDAKSIA